MIRRYFHPYFQLAASGEAFGRVKQDLGLLPTKNIAAGFYRHRRISSEAKLVFVCLTEANISTACLDYRQKHGETELKKSSVSRQRE
jgi:hypothetical protein